MVHPGSPHPLRCPACSPRPAPPATPGRPALRPSGPDPRPHPPARPVHPPGAPARPGPLAWRKPGGSGSAARAARRGCAVGCRVALSGACGLVTGGHGGARSVATVGRPGRGLFLGSLRSCQATCSSWQHNTYDAPALYLAPYHRARLPSQLRCIGSQPRWQSLLRPLPCALLKSERGWCGARGWVRKPMLCWMPSQPSWGSCSTSWHPLRSGRR